jgi:two-component system, OmpR family, response regulator AdeR
MNPLVLIVEDEPEIARILEAAVRREGLGSEIAKSGVQALELHSRSKPDLVLLDIMLPDLDGLEVLKKIRNHALTPIILLTALGEDLDKLVGLKLGADDYIVKPFNPLEVVARIKAVLRRSQQHLLLEVLRLGCLELDAAALTARVRGTRLELTLTEFRLLQALAAQPNRTFSRSELLERAMPESEALERTVDQHLRNLRRKLEQAGLRGAGQVRLEAVRGVGYRLEVV